MADVDYSHAPASNGWVQAGAAAGGLSLLSQIVSGRGNCNGGNLFNNLLGGGNCGCADNGALLYTTQLQAKLSQSESERNSEKGIVEAYKQTEANLTAFGNKIEAALAALNQEACNTRIENAKLNGRVDTLEAKLDCCCEKAALQNQITLGKVNELGIATNGQINALNQTIACLSNGFNQITKTVVPNTSVCPGWGNVTITPAAAATSGSSAA